MDDSEDVDDDDEGHDNDEDHDDVIMKWLATGGAAVSQASTFRVSFSPQEGRVQARPPLPLLFPPRHPHIQHQPVCHPDVNSALVIMLHQGQGKPRFSSWSWKSRGRQE